MLMSKICTLYIFDYLHYISLSILRLIYCVACVIQFEDFWGQKFLQSFVSVVFQLTARCCTVTNTRFWALVYAI
jgi:hypothetical protein